MIRFRNPGTQYSTQVQVLKELYSHLGNQKSFTLEDMAIVIAQSKLLTAYGYAGDEALKLSNTGNESKNSTLMNAKMYAEIFRMLGWVTPLGDKSYPLVFTYVGAHVAMSSNDCLKLYEQSVFGLVNPTDLTNKMKYSENVRFFKCALRALIDLGGMVYKHELCLFPMSVNDEDESEYQERLLFIKSIRGDFNKLDAAFKSLADKLKMKTGSVDNCTRFPIAIMKTCNLIESVNSKDLYGKSMDCLRITKHGLEVYESINAMKDLRLKEFKSYDVGIQKSLIRIGIYSMLERAEYDISSVNETLSKDKKKCKDILCGKELLFSPYQTVKRGIIEEALGLEEVLGNESSYSFEIFGSRAAERKQLIEQLDLNVPETVNIDLLISRNDKDFLIKVDELKHQGYKPAQIVEKLFDVYKDSTQAVFYPLISTLFKIIGFNCNFSRPGDNGARWDAIIDDESRSIPIEIKSPTEEQHISIKAIRQALENKIVLLSRRTYITLPNVTSLAVGYYMPNERAEVSRLIAEIKQTYGYKIGVMDLKSLLSIAVSVLIDGKSFDKEKLFELEGLINANI